LRIVVISDTHQPRGSRALPERCVAELRAADLILHAGDVVSAGFLEELRAFGPLEAVHGNMDDVELRARLPARRVVEAGGARIGMVHDAGPAAGREARLAAAFPACAAVVYGHTHVPQVERHGGAWILNPGSPTERRRAPNRGLILLDVDGGVLEPQFVALA
jgi:putative phosphoesterase